MTEVKPVSLSDSARLFVGLPVSDAAADSLWRYAQGLSGGKLVRRDMYHITLCFLGCRPRGDIQRVGDILEQIPRERMTLALGRAGKFKNGDVLWAGLREPPEALFRLQREISRALGMPEETYRPHITLARRAKSVEAAGQPREVCFSPDRIILYESLREEDRLTYRPRRWAMLPGQVNF